VSLPTPDSHATPADVADRASAATPPGAPPAGEAPEVSVVVPVYRNRDTLAELLERLEASLGGEDYELVLVVDGSPDDSLAVLRDEQTRRPRLVVVELARNCGQHAALCAGFELARGAVVLILDADLQQRPEELPAFVAAWRDGADFVSGWRTERSDPVFRRLGSHGMNWLVRQITGVKLHDWGCPLAAIDRSVFERVPGCGEQRRFLKPLVAKLSRKPQEIQVVGLEREGESAYSLLTLLGVSLDFVVSFSNRPFQKLLGLGFLGTVISLTIGTVYVTLRVAHLAEESQRLQAIVVLGMMLGIQLVILGALGEFTHRIYRLVQGLPLFEVAHVHRRDRAGS
jgi:undecaprenyl-phosphate 4-deoxy-4-formamido-L-arabinose transferase